jgi:hypothetical protein
VDAIAVTPLEDVAPAIVAVLETFASVIATPTPTFAVPPPVAEPLAIDDASADSLA